MATDIGNTPPTGPGGLAQAEATFAQVLIGPGTGGLATYFHPTAVLTSNGHTVQASGSGTVAPTPGAYRISTGATAGTIVQGGAGHDAGAFGTPFRAAQNWYVAGRFAVTTAVTAQTKAFVGLCDSFGTSSMQAGVNGATSTGFFSLVGTAGAAVVSTVAIDTLQHTHRAWRVGGTTYYSVDGIIVTGTADIATASGPFFQLTNGTDAVNRSWDLVWYGGACPFL